MPMRPTIAAAGFALPLLVAPLVLAGAPSNGTDADYVVTFIPPLPGYAYARTGRMNERGDAVGTGYACPFILSCPGRAWLWDGATTIDFTAPLLERLPPSAIGITRGVDVNEKLDAVVWLTIVDVGVFPYLWRDGEDFVEIEGPAGAVTTTAWAVNDAGTVVGTCTLASGATRAFTWDEAAGVTHVIEPPAGFTSTSARGINDLGHVAGGLSGPAGDRAFLWIDGALTELPPLPGDAGAQAVDVNDAGLVVGISTDAAFSDRFVAWQDGAIVGAVHFDGLGQILLAVDQVNDDGVVVGSYWPLQSALQESAFRWSPGDGFAQIDALDLSVPDLNIWEATGVRDDGAILAWGETPPFDPGTFILTPAATPGDLDGDGTVDVTDLVALILAWGPCADPGDCPADLDGDGAVAVGDLVILILHWGAGGQ